MRIFPVFLVVTALVLATACTPNTVKTVLDPATIPAQGIYTPDQVVVTSYAYDSYEFAAAANKSFTDEQIAKVAYCRASSFALQRGLSGWYVRDEIETDTAYLRQVNVIVTFYRGEKPPFVNNRNDTNWCQ